MQAYDAVIGTMENVMNAIGLMSGSYAVPKRMLVGALAGAFIVSYAKPSMMFLETGLPKAWSLLSPDDENSTSFPWWTAAIGGAAILGVFV